MSYEYSGCCNTPECKQKGKVIMFSIPPDKVEAYLNEPPTCTSCGQALKGNVHELPFYDIM